MGHPSIAILNGLSETCPAQWITLLCHHSPTDEVTSCAVSDCSCRHTHTHLQCNRAEELEEGVSTGLSLPLLVRGALFTDVELRYFIFCEQSKADGMLPHLAETTQYHQTIVL